MIERKIYSSWAFSEDEREKAKVNHQIYEEDYEPKAKHFFGDKTPTDEEMKQFTCYKCAGHGYSHTKYKIISNPHNFSSLELALICDDGNLCFGYRQENGLIIVHTD